MSSEISYTGRHIGNYRVLFEIAKGSFGHVYLAQHIFLTNRVAAIKLLHATHLNSEEERDRFIQEARFLETLKHPHILPIFDVGTYENFPYIVTEYAPQGSLRDRITHVAPNPLPLDEAVAILTQVGEALHHAHQQKIIHRDLKPENILFNSQGEAVLADFGIATTLATTSNQPKNNLGTPSYMAPEHFKGQVSKESDQYALGCIAYELLTGRKPFTAGDFFSLGFQHMSEPPIPPTHLNPLLPPYVEQAILKAMAKQRNERHADIPAFIQALQKPGSKQVMGVSSSQPVPPATSNNINTKARKAPPVLSSRIYPQTPGGNGTPAQLASFSGMLKEPAPAQNMYTPDSLESSSGARRIQENMLASNPRIEQGPVPPATPESFHLTPVNPLPSTPRPEKPQMPSATTHSTPKASPSRQVQSWSDWVEKAEQEKQRAQKQALPPVIDRAWQAGTKAGKNVTKFVKQRKLLAAIVAFILMVIACNIFYAIANSGTHTAPIISQSVTAKITLVPTSQQLQKTYTLTAITGTPDPAKNQLQARQLKVVTPQQSKTVNATGTGTTPATSATGTLVIENYGNTKLTLPAGTTIPNKNIQMQLDASVSVPPWSSFTGLPGTATVAAHVVQPGVTGNIGANVFCGYCNSSTVTWDAYNPNAFTGGQDAQMYNVVQQSDIDGVANSLKATLLQNAQTALQSQLQQHEQLVGTPQCMVEVASDHPANSKATTVTVTVSASCTQLAYDQQGAQTLAVSLLKKDVAANNYTLISPATVTIKQATEQQGSVVITVSTQATGRYQITPMEQQALLRLIAGKSEGEAQAELAKQAGIGKVIIMVSTGTSIPTDTDNITITVSNQSSQ